MLDILRKPKNAVKIWPYITKGQKVCHIIKKSMKIHCAISKISLGVGLNFELMLILRMYLVTAG